jgi:hypothetical protein
MNRLGAVTEAYRTTLGGNKMTETQISVLFDVMFEGDPWAGVNYHDGRSISGRRKTIAFLLKEELIEISYNWKRAWITRAGLHSLPKARV